MNGRHYNVHHRKPTSIGGTNAPENLSPVKVRDHQAWHQLFSNLGAEEICRVINEIWLDPAYELVPVKRDLMSKRKAA